MEGTFLVRCVFGSVYVTGDRDELVLGPDVEGASGLADWTRATLRPGALFIVGDPKQSIYGWRNADLASFDAFAFVHAIYEVRISCPVDVGFFGCCALI